MQFVHCLLFFILYSYCHSSHATFKTFPDSIESYPFIERQLDFKSRFPRSSRRMSPARPVVDLQARSIGPTSFLRHDHVLDFIEDDRLDEPKLVSGSGMPFSSQVQLSSKLPTLLLENNDHHLERVICHGPTINLTFRSEATLSKMWQEVKGYEKLLMITSHLGCNADDERRPYLISKVKRELNSLDFLGVATTWKQSFHSIDISFGARDASMLRRRSDLQIRDTAQPTTTSASSSSVQYPSLPSAKPTQTSVHGAGLNMSWVDVQVLPPKFPNIMNSSIIAASIPPPGLTLNCKNCSLTGNVDITHGLLTTQGLVDSSNTTENAIQFFHQGYIELATYIDAHLEFESIAAPSTSLASYTAPFPDIDVLGFTIPYIAEVGVIFRPQLTFGVSLNAGLNFTYGFSITTPQNSSIILDVHNATNSNITGFQHTQITALPFQAAIDNVNLTVGAAFTPQLLLTIGILDNAVSATAGAFLDLPKIQATVSKVNHVDESCDPVTPTENLKNYIFDSLTQVIPKVDADVGVLANIDEKLSGDKQEGLTYTAWNKTWTLPTACYSFDAGKKAYVAPTPVTTSSTSISASATTLAVGPGKGLGLDVKSGSSGLRPIELFPSPVPSFLAFVLFFSVLCYV